MNVVAESVETIQIPIAAKLGNQVLDPSNAGSRVVMIALKLQGTYPADADYTIAGTWLSDLSATPDAFWIEFLSPGNLTRGKSYKVYAKLATLAGETPKLEVPGLLVVV